jgi:predicted ester cyclase
MKASVLIVLGLLLWSPAHAEKRAATKQDVTRWYEAFNRKDRGLLDSMLSEHWVDSPAAPSQPPGRAGAKHLPVELTTMFPDLQVTIEEVLQDGHKVIVRSTITGTQRETFMGVSGQAPENDHSGRRYP